MAARAARAARKPRVAFEPDAAPAESEDDLALLEIDQAIQRLDAGIAAESKAMDALLVRLRSTRIAS